MALPLPGESLLEKGEAILTAVSEGRISPEEGNHRLATLAHYGNLVKQEKALKWHKDDPDCFPSFFRVGIKPRSPVPVSRRVRGTFCGWRGKSCLRLCSLTGLII